MRGLQMEDEVGFICPCGNKGNQKMFKQCGRGWGAPQWETCIRIVPLLED